MSNLFSLVNGVATNAACFNMQAPHQIEMQKSLYFFDRDQYDSMEDSYYEELDYGNFFESNSDCGWKRYSMSCSSDGAIGGEVIHLVDAGNFMVTPYHTISDRTVTAECRLQAYFSSYPPEELENAFPWAEATFRVQIGY